MSELYKNFAQVYDECGVSEFSIRFGESILKYLNVMHSDESFTKNLDICCGTGTLCAFFKDKSLETKGVDLSKEMLDVAHEKYPEIEFIESDVARYDDSETFDFVTCTDDALQHITDVSVTKKIINNVNRLLRPGGLFIFDVNYFELLSFDKYDKSLDEFRRLSYHLHREDKLVRFDVEYFENDELQWNGSVYEIDFSVEELAKLLNDAGFIIESCSQHFFDEQRVEKWKIVAKKIE